MPEQSKGSDKGQKSDANTPGRNAAEKDAASQSFSEEAQTGKSAIPDKAPDWAKDMPKGGNKGDK